MTGIALLSLIALSSVSWTGTEAVHMLPGISVPNLYQIHLEPNFVNNTFKGNVTIEFYVTVKTSLIEINQKDLNIISVTMEKIEVQGWEIHHTTEIMIVTCNDLLQLNEKYRMNIVYEGVLGTSGYGFYTSNYIDGEVTKWIATTHFQPTGARLVFPCWDEPEYKADFEISITHLKNYTTVLSNMARVKQTVVDDETVTTHFYRTLEMSTYLVAFTISDYAYKSHIDDRIRIYTKPGSVIHTEYAYNFTVRALKLLDDYTNMHYFEFMPKIDQITLRTFESKHAMENWGLMIYKEDLLLYEKGVTTTTEKEMISRTIAHGLSHQWFGNLVGLKWWDNLWLNEGFSKYFEMYILHKLEPTWRVMEMFVVDTMQGVSFVRDATINTLAINRHVVSQDDVMRMYSEFSYRKAACVIRMFSHILTEETFRQGLGTYLDRYKLRVVDSDDLLYRLSDAFGSKKLLGGRSFLEVADDWINKAGYPLVTVTKVSPGHYFLTQERFTSHGFHSFDTKWWIPINYVTNYKLNFIDTTVTHWLTPNNLTIFEPDSDWILVNKQQIGFYRVNYDEETWHNLTKVLKTNMHKIHPVNRAQLIDDVFTLAHKNITKYETALSLALYLNKEIDCIPWMTAFRHLEILRNVMFEVKHFQTFKHYIRFIMHSLTKNVTYEASPKDDHPTKILKAKAMHFACLADVKECLDSARKHFNAWLKDPHYKLDPDLRYVIICTGLRTASQDVWDQTRKILEKDYINQKSKKDPLKALGCSSNPETLKKFLLDSMDADSKIDFLNAVKAIISNTNVSGINIVQEVMERDLDHVIDIDDFKDEVAPTIPVIAVATVNSDQYFKLTSFTARTSASLYYTAPAVERSNRNLLWIRDYSDRVDRWLVVNEKSFSSSGTLVFTSFFLILSIFMTRYF